MNGEDGARSRLYLVRYMVDMSPVNVGALESVWSVSTGYSDGVTDNAHSYVDIEVSSEVSEGVIGVSGSIDQLPHRIDLTAIGLASPLHCSLFVLSWSWWANW